MRAIDLRSDTVTKPSPEMLRAMCEAPLGDDVFGDDPTVNRLEEKVAELLHKEAALFVPSGTMANLIAVLLHCRPGDEAICEAGSHPANFEVGGASAIGGAQLHCIEGARGILTADQVRGAIRPANIHVPRTALVLLENTHNRGGGTVYPLATFREVAGVAAEHGVPVHLDGARLMNACVASGLNPSDYSELSTTTSTCFSKGLGAPVGSAIAGPRGLIEEGRRFRKRLGGGMRQAGVLAAAAIYALDHNVERLAEDHENARAFAEAVADVGHLVLDPAAVETNIVIIPLQDGAPDAPEFQKKAEESGVRVVAISRRSLRAVTHLDVSRADVLEAAERLRRAWA